MKVEEMEVEVEVEVEVDGSQGGGQILRSSLSLGAILGKSFTVTHIRATRPKPGLQAQHLACVLAVQSVTNAHVEGAELGSMQITMQFYDGKNNNNGDNDDDNSNSNSNNNNTNNNNSNNNSDNSNSNNSVSNSNISRSSAAASSSGLGGIMYPAVKDSVFSIGTAGSVTLLLQTLLPIFLFACRESSSFVIEGGTHIDLAPSTTFIEETFLPILQQIGINARGVTERVGLLPEGNGRLRVMVEPILNVQSLPSRALTLPKINGRVSGKVFYKKESSERFKELGMDIEEINCGYRKKPSYALCIRVETNLGSMVITSADFKNNIEKIVEKGLQQLQNYLSSELFVDEFLSDQLLLYIALGVQIEFKVDAISDHFRTNIEVIEKFLGCGKILVTKDFTVKHCSVITA